MECDGKILVLFFNPKLMTDCNWIKRLNFSILAGNPIKKD